MHEAAAPQQRRLQGNILESVIRGQERQELAQLELDRQGLKLRQSVDQAQLVAGRTDAVAQAVDNLASEARVSSLLSCCCRRRRQVRPAHKSESSRLRRLAEKSPSEESDNESIVLLPSSVDLKKLQRKDQVASWRRTLAPPPGSRSLAHGSDIWLRQVDASLVKLQHDAEDMGESLDEQIKLAQMLTIYLNYGADQLLGTNEKLAAEKSLF